MRYVVSATPRPLFFWAKDGVRISQRENCASRLVRTGAVNIAPCRDLILGPSKSVLSGYTELDTPAHSPHIIDCLVYNL